MTYLILLLLTLTVTVYAGSTQNGLTQLYSTGVTATGALSAVGSQDQHWYLNGLVVIQGIGNSTSSWPIPTTFPQPMYIVPSTPPQASPSGFQWISPDSVPNAILPGNFLYYIITYFQLADLSNDDTVQITLDVAVQERLLSVIINGVTSSVTVSSVGPDSFTTLSFQNTYDVFRKGTNSIEFVIEHAVGSPLALAVQVVTASAQLTLLDYEYPSDSPEPCDHFNIYLPGTPLPEGYTDLSDILPNIVLDAEGKVTLPCVPTLNTGYFVPQVLSVVYSYYGEPICAVIVDCNMAGVGQILPTITNNRRQEPLTFVAEEVCSNPGVFFGCIDSAFGEKLQSTQVGPAGPVATGEFADTLTIGYTDPYGLASAPYNIWLVCGNQPHWSFDLISSLMLIDAFNRSIEKLTSLREKILQVQGLLFNNVQDIPCEEIGMITDLSGTALDFFNFLECLGDRELSEDAFLYNTDTIKSEVANSTGICDPISPLVPYSPPASELAK